MPPGARYIAYWRLGVVRVSGLPDNVSICTYTHTLPTIEDALEEWWGHPRESAKDIARIVKVELSKCLPVPLNESVVIPHG